MTKETDVEFFLCINGDGDYKILGASRGAPGEIRALVESGIDNGSVHRLKIKVPLPSADIHIDEVV
jgi:hypothetical protein